MEQIDRQILLLLNGSDSTFLDSIFLAITRTSTWIPMLLVLVYIVYRTSGTNDALSRFKRLLLFAVAFALVIVICDQTASSLCKPLFHRLRPSHEPALYGLVDLVNGRRGGLYGFFSSHAANSFGVATFTALTLHRRLPALTLFLWACLTSYSRIYLGFHYPGDILAGILFGIFTGWLICRMQRRLLPDVAVATTSSAASMPAASVYLLLPVAFLLTLVAIAIVSL